jgi:hypothetical protein
MTLTWEIVQTEMQEKGFLKNPAPYVVRAKVPGGWFVKADDGIRRTGGAFFYPDPEHQWDGSSLP